MLKLTIACTVAMVGLVGCSSERANSSPPETAPGVDFQYNDPESADSKQTEPDTAEPDAKKAESSKTEADKSHASKHEATRESSMAPAQCTGLTQKKCEISNGCAWHTDKKCVAQ